LNNEIKEVGELIQFVESLQHRVKQLLEVMDEHYGKTLRVFTMVTVLFTPLYVTQCSLVSDFPGSGSVTNGDPPTAQLLDGSKEP
jgi:hypothetical protein